TDQQNCSATLTAVVGVNPGVGTGQVNQTNVLCNGDSTGSATVIIANGTAPYSCIWQHDALNITNTATNLAAGSYNVTITDAPGACITPMTVTISQPAVLVASVTIADISCYNMNDGVIAANGSGGTLAYQYHWSDNSSGSNLGSLPAGIYSLTITDANNCVDSVVNIIITNPAELTLTTSSTNPLCYNMNNGTAIATANGGTPPYVYSWPGGISGPAVSNLSAGSHIVSVTDAHLCPANSIVTLYNPVEMVSIGTSGIDANTHGGFIQLNVTGGSLPYSYLWSNTATSQNLSGLSGGTYIVTITDAGLCAITDTFTIDLPLEIPTVITPNGDGKNDDFEILSIQAYHEVSIEIYNRWGDRLFVYTGTGASYASKANRWDGKNNGKDLPMGSYVFIVKLNDLDPITGVVSIIR
ncbi:MAG: T9SS type B sorting domain-containing protein, partial [Bacteroidetes bacterium]|nr:T9SS type B sorting domain-containing protein [Bacteroidota bacterium]